MQVILGIAILIVAITIIIYKLNDKFEKKEFYILLTIIVITTVSFIYFEKSNENLFPKLFKEKYEADKNLKLESLESELLNNKVVSSKDKFIYKFTYIVKKDDKEFLCNMDKVEIHKVKDNFVFINFSQLKEECLEK